MANHAYVTTRKVMSPEKITEIVERLNRDLFHNTLQIKHGPSKGDPLYWWDIVVAEADQEWGSRSFWLQTPRKFEMRHGMGGNFIWWIDTMICNDVALAYNGRRTDDGTGPMESLPVVPNQYPTYRSYLEMATQHYGHGEPPDKAAFIQRWAMQTEMRMVPPSFRFDLGKKIRLQHGPGFGEGQLIEEP